MTSNTNPSEDLVNKSLVTLWKGHLESHANATKFAAEKDELSQQAEKSMCILNSILSDDNPGKVMVIYQVQLNQMIATAENMLFTLRTKARSMQVIIHMS